MKKFTIAVGTTSAQKIGYLKEVLKELNIKAIITNVNVRSEVSEQPKTSAETKKGSINRAKNALKKTKDADFSIGIEVGYHMYFKNKYEMFCWATIIDKHGHQTSGQSYRFLLPEYHQKVLGKDKYMCDSLDGYLKKVTNSINIYIDNMIRHRKPFITGAIRDTLIRYLGKEDFK